MIKEIVEQETGATQKKTVKPEDVNDFLERREALR